MPRGYAGKFLEVDLSSEEIKDLTFDEEILRNFVGGRGLAAKILWDRFGERWESIDPLGPENLFLALTGPLTAIYPGTRICISGKSPQCNGIIGSTLSGEFPVELKCAGYDGVIVSGKAEKPVYILITDDHAEIRDAKHIWGKEAIDTVRILTKEVRNYLEEKSPNAGKIKQPGIIYCGPAGESRVRTAAVLQKISHAAGYGGYGAVMGSKNLKAIVAKGRRPLPDVANPSTVKILWREVDRRYCRRDRTFPGMWGTGYGGYSVGAGSSSEPVRNWQDEWHDERRFGGPKFDFKYWVKRYWSDFNCAGSCMKLAVIKTGPYKGTFTDNPDYEMEAYLGPNLGVFDPGECIYLSALMDYLGFSGINGGNTLAFAAELYQRGILTKEDLGFELKWGDVEAFEKLARMIVKREGIGDILAEGTYRAALKISKMKGVDVTKYAVHVKGVEVGAHGTRSGLDYRPIGYACSPQCGDHTSGVYDAYNDMWMVFADSAVVCSIVADRELIWDYYRAVTGWDITEEDWNKTLGHRIIHIQRAALLLGGPDIVWDPKIHDDNPPRFYEPLPSGPYKGKTTDRKVVEEMKKQYYEAIGWDENGIPKSEVLRKLGLKDVDKVLEKLRK
ncbi:aldehyde ferredoxin oxidoreductase [Candidatus Bathyarchaeota archaeon]|nr:MAG: aldehyde ferredoxin oxidoreductase [Candidatus Bathyarchaeota archaeon]